MARVGEAPERILYTQIMLDQDWIKWTAIEENPVEILRPEMEYEGAELPLNPSKRGEIKERDNSLRDPYVFENDDGRTFLLYTGAGEHNICMAEIELE